MLLQSKKCCSKLIKSLLSHAHWPFKSLNLSLKSSSYFRVFRFSLYNNTLLKAKKKPVFKSVSSSQMVYIQIYTLQTNITTKVASLKIRNIFLKITPIPNNIYIYIQSYHQRISLQRRLNYHCL